MKNRKSDFLKCCLLGQVKRIENIKYLNIFLDSRMKRSLQTHAAKYTSIDNFDNHNIIYFVQNMHLHK